MVASRNTTAVSANKLISREMFKYFYDLSKLTYAGTVLVGVQQNKVKSAIMGVIAVLVLFILARVLEEKCSSCPSSMMR